MSSGSMCTFNGGALIAYCERGCCGDSCCSTTSTEGGGITYALIGIIASLIVIFFILVALYLFLRRKGYCRSRPDAELAKPWRPKPVKANKKNKKKPTAKKAIKKKKGQIMAMNAFDWHGKKKDVQKDSKDTQTDSYKCLPGDFIKWSNGFWLPVKRVTGVPKDERENIRDIGVNTEAMRNNTRTINIEPKINNTDIVTKINTAATPRAHPPPREVKPAHTRAPPVSTHLQPPGADYRDVKLPYDVTPRQQRSGGEIQHSGGEIQHSRGERHHSGDGNSSAKSVSFGSSPQPTVSTPMNADRQDTIELLNEFSRQMMKPK